MDRVAEADKIVGYATFEYKVKAIIELPLLGTDTPFTVLERQKKEVVPEMSVNIGGCEYALKAVNVKKQPGECVEASVKLLRLRGPK
jgi:hypothetical protein